MQSISLTRIQFPEISLQSRDAHKLRGYFGKLFKEHSPLLHNHYESGELRYRYPLVQYKVLNKVPTLIALNEGSDLLTSLFMKIKKLQIDGKEYDVLNKNISNINVEAGYSNQLYEYKFQTLWMALNQSNYRIYQKADEAEKIKILQNILIGNVLSLLKGLDIHLDEDQRLMAIIKPFEKTTKFKDHNMIAFSGSFVINALLPRGIGIGKGVSRGFGTIE